MRQAVRSLPSGFGRRLDATAANSAAAADVHRNAILVGATLFACAAAERQAVSHLKMNIKQTGKLLMVVACAAIVFFSRRPLSELGSREIGVIEGMAAVARGDNSLRLIGGGIPESFETILKTKYGIGAYRVGGCTAPRTRFARTDGYNRVVSKALSRRFGRDVVQDAFAEALALEKTRVEKRSARRS